MSVWEPKGHDGLPRISSGMCPVTTERFNDAVLLVLGGCGCLSVCLQREKQPGSQREAGQLGIWARQPALGSGAQRGPAGLRRGGGVEPPLAAPGFSCHFINTLIESKAAAG